VDGLLIRSLWFVVLVMLVAAMLSAVVSPVYAAEGQYIANNTPAYVSSATNLGEEDPSRTIEVSIWLQPYSRSMLDALAQDLYNPTSPSYRQWLKSSEIAARFAPTSAEAKTVQDFFESKNLKVFRIGKNNFYVRARGRWLTSRTLSTYKSITIR
jgi:subtilase family serine protease